MPDLNRKTVPMLSRPILILMIAMLACASGCASRYGQISKLHRKTNDRISEREYPQALDAVEQILRLDAHDEFALGVRPLLVSYAADVIDPDEQKDLDVELSMDKRISGTVEFKGEPLHEVLDEMGRRLNLVVQVDWNDLLRQKVKPDAAVTMRQSNAPADKVLTAILDSVTPEPRTIVYGVRDAGLLISSRDSRNPTITHIYILKEESLRAPNFDDDTGLDANAGRTRRTGNFPSDPSKIRQNNVEHLMILIQETVDPDSWRDNGGSFGSIRYFNERLFVTQTLRNHFAIRKLLKKLDVAFISL